MDRLALALMAVALVIGLIGFSRTGEVRALHARAAAAEARVQSARQDLDQLRRLPADRRRLPDPATTLARFDTGALRVRTPLDIRAQMDPSASGPNPWAPLRGEGMKVTMITEVSQPAVVAWTQSVIHDYAVLLTQLQWDGRIGTVHAVAVGP